jgi:hypothetical protein
MAVGPDDTEVLLRIHLEGEIVKDLLGRIAERNTRQRDEHVTKPRSIREGRYEEPGG